MTFLSEVIERSAEAIYDERRQAHMLPGWDNLDEGTKDCYRAEAEAALNAAVDDNLPLVYIERLDSSGKTIERIYVACVRAQEKDKGAHQHVWLPRLDFPPTEECSFCHQVRPQQP